MLCNETKSGKPSISKADDNIVKSSGRQAFENMNNPTGGCLLKLAVHEVRTTSRWILKYVCMLGHQDILLIHFRECGSTINAEHYYQTMEH